MSAPLIWIGFPAAMALLLWLIHRRQLLVIFLAVGLCLFLALLAWLLPIATPVRLGPWAFEIQSTLVILGRQFVLDAGDEALLVFLYLVGAFWFLGGWVVKSHPYFVPLGLAMLVLSIAALSVEPFLYAALIVELIVLLSIPLLVPPGRSPGQGVLRYLIFQSLAMPFMLFAGWASSGFEANPADTKLLGMAMTLLALGFSFWLAVFPFYTWAPLMAEEVDPYVSGFILCLLPIVVLLLVLDFLNGFAWLREYPLLLPALRLMGILMVVSGGVWSAFQRNQKRLLGYAFIVENGFALLALSLGSRIGFQVMVMSFLPRVIALGIWSMGLTILQNRTSLDFDSATGLMRYFPFATLAVLAGIFSLAGLPLLAGFPIRLALMENLAQQSLTSVLWVVIGISGLWVSGFRVLASVVIGEQEGWKSEESKLQTVFLVTGILIVLFIGIFPRWFLPVFQNLLQAFEHLK